MKHNPGTLNAAILTVCVEQTIVQQIVQAADQLPWILSTGDFESYVSDARRPHITQQIKTADICVAVVDFDEDAVQAVESARYLQHLFSGKVALVALSKSQDPDLLLLAMRAGCREFISKPFDEGAFIDLLERLDQQRTNVTIRNATSGSVVSFFGAKGGVGTTTLAVHLAMYLVQCHQKKTLLIDNHPELGHVCVYLGLDGSRSHFHELVRNVNRLDSELLRGFTAKHSSGLEVLSSPDVCGGMRGMEADSVSKLLEFLRSEYDYVIIDCATSLHDTNLAVIDSSTQVYLVATPEIGAIRDLSRYVDNLTQIEYTTEKMHVVINRFSSRYAVSVEQIEKAIRLPVAIKLPNSYTELVRSVNLGEPISPKRKSEFSVQFVKWANTLVGASPNAPQETKSKSVFAFLGK